MSTYMVEVCPFDLIQTLYVEASSAGEAEEKIRRQLNAMSSFSVRAQKMSDVINELQTLINDCEEGTDNE